MALKFEPLKVEKVVRETPDAITVHFHIPDKDKYRYQPGQYLTLRVHVNGKPCNRAYSLCSCPDEDNTLAVTVKRTGGGVVSNWLNDHLQAGMQLEVLPPMGNFTAKPEADKPRHYILIGAGSGITPLYSIMRTVLHRSPNSKVTLLYGNRNEESIIFRLGLAEVASGSGGKVHVLHSLTQPGDGWSGHTGRLTRGKIRQLVEDASKDIQLQPIYYVCGPSAMMDEALHALKQMNVPSADVFVEHFSAPLTDPMAHEATTSQAPSATPSPQAEEDDNGGKVITRTIKVRLEGEERELTVMPSQSILDAALDNDLDPPYACMIGSCCTCKAKLVSGKVVMDDREGLTDDEIREGYVLTCQSHPLTANVLVDYDQI